MRARTDGGFTLIELMVAVLVLGILVALAVPIYVNSRLTAQRKACFANERTVESSFYQYMAEEGEDSVAGVSNWVDVMGILVPRHFVAPPECPAGGTYSWVAKEAVCDRHGHFPTP